MMTRSFRSFQNYLQMDYLPKIVLSSQFLTFVVINKQIKRVNNLSWGNNSVIGVA